MKPSLSTSQPLRPFAQEFVPPSQQGYSPTPADELALIIQQALATGLLIGQDADGCGLHIRVPGLAPTVYSGVQLAYAPFDPRIPQLQLTPAERAQQTAANRTLPPPIQPRSPGATSPHSSGVADFQDGLGIGFDNRVGPAGFPAHEEECNAHVSPAFGAVGTFAGRYHMSPPVHTRPREKRPVRAFQAPVGRGAPGSLKWNGPVTEMMMKLNAGHTLTRTGYAREFDPIKVSHDSLLTCLPAVDDDADWVKPAGLWLHPRQ